MPMPCPSTGEKLPEVKRAHRIALDEHVGPVAQRLAVRRRDAGQESTDAALSFALDGLATAKRLLLPSEHPAESGFEGGRVQA